MKPTRPIGLDFFESAPLRIPLTAVLPASPERVFAEFAEPASWLQWFPLMTKAEWTSSQTHCVGAERFVKLRLFGSFAERFIAWEPPVGAAPGRFAFTMTATDSPMASAIGEDYRLTAVPEGARLDWVFAADPTAFGRLSRPILQRVMTGLFKKGLRQLEAYLRKGAAT
jgi:hypothetical protein